MPKGIIPSKNTVVTLARDTAGVAASWGAPQAAPGLVRSILGGVVGLWLAPKYIAGSDVGKTACKVGGLVNIADGILEQIFGGKGAI